MNKIFITGGRSGTTLLLNLLCETEKYKNAGKYKKGIAQEPDGLMNSFFKNFPRIQKNIINFKDFDIAKSPEFIHIIDKIRRKYNHKIIILRRLPDDMLESFKKAKRMNIVRNRIAENKELTNLLIYRYNSLDILKSYCRYYNELLEIEKEKKNVLFIEYEHFMSRFNNTMIKISEFLGIKPKLKEWNELRKINWKGKKR